MSRSTTPGRAAPGPWTARLAAILCAFGVAACAETGDFGRPKPTVWTTSIAPSVGLASAAARGEPASLALLTDDEQELRGRAWRFLTPARDRAFFDRQLAELAATRIIPASATAAAQAVPNYFEALMGDADRSPRPRYQRLREDAEADRQLIVAFAAVFCRVAEMDRARAKALAAIPPEETATRALATNRLAENEMLAQWVEYTLDLRIRGYRFALERLVVTSPDKDAIRAERTLDALEGYRGLTARCFASRGDITVAPGVGPGPRFLPRTEPELPPK
ncbi:hypothetical protein SLNSH_13680 [Alsobacter soli]|uniref:Uncharacterized protein n=1 Tax=Alsobacter soli TaxID=2109933 RepID=A0A2T1HSA3_9HYPH|nr:hypothetical protein [Alsobacter soli]PSC04541.1 hypothetical protein SLNSH_13680 [Alsobacter soli]